MSFIYDNDKLIEKLLISGIESVVKEAQVKGKKPNEPAPAPVDYAAYHVADALTVQLQRQLGVPGAPPKGVPLGIEKGAAPNPSATTTDLRTLGDFLQWCAKSKLTWENKRFAWLPDEPHQTQAENPDIWDFESMTSDRKRDEVTRTPVKIAAVADVSAVTGYLTYLRDNEKNQVTRLMLSKLIGELNTFLRTGNRNAIDTVSKPEAKTDFDPNDFVDGFKNDTLGGGDVYDGVRGYPFFEQEPIKLKAGDIAGQGAFLAWLRNMKVKLPDNKVVSATQADSDAPCVAVNILYKRALWLKQYGPAADKQKANYSKLADRYLTVIQEYGKQLTGANGKPCTVTTAGTGTTPTPNATPGAPGTEVTGAVLQQVADALPLSAEDIDFDRIRYFFSLYKKILGSSNEEGATASIQAMDDAERKMPIVSGATINNETTYSLSADPHTYANMLQQPAITRYIPVLQNLEYIVDQTASAVRHFYNQYSSKMNSAQRSRIQAQFAGSNSYQMRDKMSLQRLMAGRSTIGKFV